MSAVQSARLTIHVLDHDVVDLTEGSTVFQNLPRLIGVEVNLNQLLVTYGQQTVALKMAGEIGVDGVLVEDLPSISSWVSYRNSIMRSAFLLDGMSPAGGQRLNCFSSSSMDASTADTAFSTVPSANGLSSFASFSRSK